MSVKLVRRLAELLLLLGACGGLSFFLQQQSASRPTWISGIVVDWNTGKRVGNAAVFSMEMNSSREMGRTDSKGLFSISVPSEPRPYFLYAGGPSFGRLLQSTFGRGLIVWGGGERHSGIVLAGIPATLLTGHVYDGASTPFSGCEVAGLTKSAASKKGQEGESPYRSEVVVTDKSGFFSFNYLGADRYFFVASCHKYLPGELAGYAGTAPSVRSIHSSWPVTVFPNARSFERAEEVVLLPGDRRERLDFHLQAAARYSIHGHIVLSDGSRPRSFPATFYRARYFATTR